MRDSRCKHSLVNAVDDGRNFRRAGRREFKNAFEAEVCEGADELAAIGAKGKGVSPEEPLE